MEAFSYYLLVLITILFLHSLTDRIGRKLKNLPPSPPFSLPIFGHLHYLKTPSVFAHLADKYGPILLLYFGSRPILLVSSPSAVEECLTKNDVIFADRPRFLAGKYLGYDYTTLVWAPYGQLWRNLRKLATVEIFSTKRIQGYANLRREEVHLMMQRLMRSAQADEFGVVNLKSAFFELTLSILMRMVAGKREYRDEEEKIEEARKFREVVKGSNLVNVSTNIPDYVPLSKWTGGRGKLLRMLEGLMAKRDGFMQSVIEERRKILSRYDAGHEEADKCMIDVLLSLQQKEPEFYKDEIIKGVVQTMLVGGTETTAISMEWSLSLLLNHPNVLNKAYQEIQNRIGESNRLMNDSDLNHLPYLQAIIDETLRLYPASALIGHHEASKDCTVGGYHIPRGTILFVNVRAMQNHPKVWEEPTKYKPERFVRVETEKFGFDYLPFGYGRRGCPGETSARRVMGLTLGSLIQCFEWNRVGKELLDMSEGAGLNVPRATPLLANCIPRPEMVKLLSQNY